MPPEASFVIGLILGAARLRLIQVWKGRPGAATGRVNHAVLESDNSRLNGELAGLKERLLVLEAIATDPAHRTAVEIERLR